MWQPIEEQLEETNGEDVAYPYQHGFNTASLITTDFLKALRIAVIIIVVFINIIRQTERQTDKKTDIKTLYSTYTSVHRKNT